MRVLDLFSGIGGFAIGPESVGMQTVAFCEQDGYARRVLKKHWPETWIYEDVRTLPRSASSPTESGRSISSAAASPVRTFPRRQRRGHRRQPVRPLVGIFSPHPRNQTPLGHC